MKKLLIAVVALGIAGSASASSVDFLFGTNFFKPSWEGYTAENGQNFTVAWNLDGDVTLGVYNEQTATYDAVGTAADTLVVSAIQVSKGVIKAVKVGLNLGSAMSLTAGDAAPLADVYGQVKILSGSGDKIEGALVATVAARFSECDLDANAEDSNGANVSLAVLLGF